MPHMVKNGGNNSCQDLSSHVHQHASSLLSLANSSTEVPLTSERNNLFVDHIPSSENHLLERHSITEQREQDSDCGEQRPSEGSTKESSLPKSLHSDSCTVKNNLVTPTRTPMNGYSPELKTLPPIPLPNVHESNISSEHFKGLQHVNEGTLSVNKIEDNSSDKENQSVNHTITPNEPPFSRENVTSEQTTTAGENTKETDKSHKVTTIKENPEDSNVMGSTNNQNLNGKNICSPNNVLANSPSHSQIPPGCYYPPQTSPYPDHYPIMMGSPHHSHAHFPLHPYKNWSQSYGGYPYGGYTGGGYSPQIPHLFSNPYGPLPTSLVSPPFNTNKNDHPSVGTMDADIILMPSKLETRLEGEKLNITTIATASDGESNDKNSNSQTGKDSKKKDQVLREDSLQRSQDNHKVNDSGKAIERGEIGQNDRSKIKEETDSYPTHSHNVLTEAAAIDNDKEKCNIKRHCNDITPNHNGKNNDDNDKESPQKKRKECENENRDTELSTDSSREASKQFSSPGHIAAPPPFYSQYMPSTSMTAQHGVYPYGRMIPRYDQMYPYSSSFCGGYSPPPYSMYGPQFSGHMQGGWGNGGVRGLTPYSPYPSDFSPAPNSKNTMCTGSDKCNGRNISKNKIAGIAEHIERHQALTKNTAIGNDVSLSSPEINRVKSAERCIRMPLPHPTKFWSEEETNDTVIPDFQQLVNYPTYINKNRAPLAGGNSSQTGTRFCVMCGKERRCTSLTANGSSRARHGKSSAHFAGCYSSCEDEDRSLHIIPRQNKGLCTSCDVAVWIVIKSELEIKWCKGCKNFKPWAAFGDKGHATKCVRCRERQREKYATKKELMMKNRDVWKSKKDSDSDRDDVKVEDSLSHTFSPRGHEGLSCLLAATAQVTSSLQQGIDA